MLSIWLDAPHQKVSIALPSPLRGPDDPQAAKALGDALEAAAHGHAMLLLDGSYGEGPDAVDRAATQAVRVTGALIQGRAALG